MGKEYTDGSMVEHIKVITKTTKRMATEFTFGPMAELTLATGPTVNSMVMASIFCQTVLLNLLHGIKANDLENGKSSQKRKNMSQSKSSKRFKLNSTSKIRSSKPTPMSSKARFLNTNRFGRHMKNRLYLRQSKLWQK